MVIDYGTFVKTRRMELGLTQNDLADAACINRVTLWNIEKGGGCTLDSFLSVIAALGLKIDFQEVDK